MLFRMRSWRDFKMQLKKEEMKVLFCWNSRRYCNFMTNFPETCPHQDKGIAGKNCNPEDCDYCKEQIPSKYYKYKLKILRGLK